MTLNIGQKTIVKKPLRIWATLEVQKWDVIEILGFIESQEQQIPILEVKAGLNLKEGWIRMWTNLQPSPGEVVQLFNLKIDDLPQILPLQPWTCVRDLWEILKLSERQLINHFGELATVIV
jgi:hypothetical protein